MIKTLGMVSPTSKNNPEDMEHVLWISANILCRNIYLGSFFGMQIEINASEQFAEAAIHLHLS